MARLHSTDNGMFRTDRATQELASFIIVKVGDGHQRARVQPDARSVPLDSNTLRAEIGGVQ